LPALVLTGASGLLLSALDHPHGNASAAGAGLGGGLGDSSGQSAGAASTTLVDSAATPTVADQAGASTTTAAGRTPASSVPRPPASSKTTVAGKSSGGGCVVTAGPTVETRWGPVQVKASVSSSGKICAVDAIQTPSDHRRSVAINNYAVPVLDQQAMDVQSANIDGVSGATITSNAYARSLQAIIDQVKA
jgi:uncharacterized protein with FMN-binding domain